MPVHACLPAQPLLKCSLELLKHALKHAPALEAHKAAMIQCLVRSCAVVDAPAARACADASARPQTTLAQKKRRDALGAAVTRESREDAAALVL